MRLDEPVFRAVSKPLLTEFAFILDWRVVWKDAAVWANVPVKDFLRLPLAD